MLPSEVLGPTGPKPEAVKRKLWQNSAKLQRCERDGRSPLTEVTAEEMSSSSFREPGGSMGTQQSPLWKATAGPSTAATLWQHWEEQWIPLLSPSYILDLLRSSQVRMWPQGKAERLEITCYASGKMRESCSHLHPKFVEPS